MTRVKNKTALITGGSRGIGAATAKLLIENGATVIITDILDDEGRALANEIHAEYYHLNVTKEDEFAKVFKMVNDKYGRLDILFNNAGIITSNQFFYNMDHTEIDRTMQVNTVAHLHVTRSFLPAMIQQKSGHIINISSAAGFIPNPRLSVYCASKHAISGWSESLRLELESMNGDFHVTTVTPAYIDTGMFAGVRSPLIPIAKPEVAARSIIKGVLKNKVYVRIPGIVYIAPFFKGILPVRWADFLVGKVFGFAKSMDEFKGRNTK